MAKIYLAGSYLRRAELFERAKDLVQAGHTVTSRWLKGNADIDTQDQVDMDLVDLLASDTVLSFVEPQGNYTTGGRHVEFGYALALNHTGDERRLMLVGWPENIFHHDQDVEQFPSFEAALEALGPITAGSVIAAARRQASSL